MQITTEIVTMTLADNVTREEFIGIVGELESNFHSIQPGFIDTELLYDEKNNQWIMIQHWESKEQLHTASKKMFQDAITQPFVKALDPKSVKMTIAPQLKRWEA